jgi:hypothetical protein
MVAAAALAVVARGVVLDEDGEGITSAEALQPRLAPSGADPHAP